MATKDEDGVWVQMCYFVEFEKDDKGFWTRKFVGDEEGNVRAIHARKSISYDELYKKVMEELKIDSGLYELEMRCENPVPSTFPEPPMKIDCDNQVRFLMANLDRTKLSITLKKKAMEPYVVKSGASIELLEKLYDVDIDVDVDGRDVCCISGESSETYRVEKSHNIAVDGNGRDGYGLDELVECNIEMVGYNADTYGLGAKRPRRGVPVVDPSLLCSSCKDVVLNVSQSSFVKKKKSGRKRRQNKHLLSVGHEVDVREDYKGEAPTASVEGTITRQRKCCLHCGSDTTPRWRVGPMGRNTLCNACGLRYKFSGLVPEYHHSCSTTSSARLHSNSHSNIIVLKKQKQQVVGNACGVRHEMGVRGDDSREAPTAIVGGSITGQVRGCLDCGTDTTPQWHVGPMGPNTLCNACGVKYKSDCLVPESRPTFSTRLHSNSHKKIIVMRTQKQPALDNAYGDDRGEAPTAIVGVSITGQRRGCLHCGFDTTPMWRDGPMGPNTLCNACGLRYKSGLLDPCSPTSSDSGEAPTAIVGGTITGGRKCCLHCGTDTTPQWRDGPMGHHMLCNACGLSYKKGRLVPEYRPACSPTFSAGLHSNFHETIIKMQKQKQQGL